MQHRKIYSAENGHEVDTSDGFELVPCRGGFRWQKKEADWLERSNGKRVTILQALDQIFPHWKLYAWVWLFIGIDIGLIVAGIKWYHLSLIGIMEFASLLVFSGKSKHLERKP